MGLISLTSDTDQWFVVLMGWLRTRTVNNRRWRRNNSTHSHTHSHKEADSFVWSQGDVPGANDSCVCVTSVVIAACRILQDYIEGVMVATRIRFTEFQTCKFQGVTEISICMKCGCVTNIDRHRGKKRIQIDTERFRAVTRRGKKKRESVKPRENPKIGFWAESRAPLHEYLTLLSGKEKNTMNESLTSEVRTMR